MSLRLFVFLCFALVSAVASSNAIAAETAFARVEKNKTINCGYLVWPPFVIKEPNTGKLSGINYDVMEALGKNLGLKVNWVAEVGAGEAAAALDANKFDVMCASLWQSPGRLMTMTLTRPTFYSPAYAFTRAGDKRFDGNIEKANAKNVKVAVIDGDYSQDLAKEKLPEATVVSLPMLASGSEMLLQVLTNKADIVMGDEGFINDFMKTHPNALRKVGGTGIIRTYGELLAVRRGEYQLKNMLDQSILQLAYDGVIAGITRKYEKQYNVKYFPPARSFAEQ
ncbi:MAG: ABC transporter substrate-binding protein [Alphaproteobacteria bacterium]|nr:ABC transporter substrate-binding protein [Alphaproteobacteria bacterium]